MTSIRFGRPTLRTTGNFWIYLHVGSAVSFLRNSLVSDSWAYLSPRERTENPLLEKSCSRWFENTTNTRSCNECSSPLSQIRLIVDRFWIGNVALERFDGSDAPTTIQARREASNELDTNGRKHVWEHVFECLAESYRGKTCAIVEVIGEPERADRRNCRTRNTTSVGSPYIRKRATLPVQLAR